MKTLLHVGCGTKRKVRTTRGFNTDAWTGTRRPDCAYRVSTGARMICLHLHALHCLRLSAGG